MKHSFCDVNLFTKRSALNVCRFDVNAPTKNRTDFSTNMSECGKEIAVSVVCYMPLGSQIADCILYIYKYM